MLRAAKLAGTRRPPREELRSISKGPRLVPRFAGTRHADGKVVIRRQLKRRYVLAFFQSCVVWLALSLRSLKALPVDLRHPSRILTLKNRTVSGVVQLFIEHFCVKQLSR